MTNPAREPTRETTGHAPPGFLAWVGALVHAHRAQLLAFARRRGLTTEDALDAVQDGFVSFLKLPEARNIANTPDDAIKMLTVLVRHVVMNRRRKRVRHTRIEALLGSIDPESSESSETLVAQAEELARVHGCIQRMAALQRRVVMLSLLDEHPHSEVAQLLGISDAYVRVLLHRARAHLRDCTFEHDERGEA